MLDGDFLQPERLRAFVAVVEAGSFSRAAERLRLAQPTVSIQVRRLEEAVGDPLLDRGSTPVVPTKRGEALLGYARELLEVMARARRQFSHPPLEGTVRLGIVEDFNYAAFAEFLGGVRRHHSRFELAIEMDSAARLHERLRGGALDIALTKRLAGGAAGGALCRQALAWVGLPDALRDEDDVVPLALTPPGTATRDAMLRALRGAGRRWSVRIEAPTVTGLQAAVLAGVGVSAFGVGMIPAGLARLPAAAALPALGAVEFALDLNPDSRDPVVATFADVVRRLAPLIVARLAEEQAEAPG